MSYIKKTIIWYLLLVWSVANWFYVYAVGTCYGGLGDSSKQLFIPVKIHCSIAWLLPILFLIGVIVSSIIVLRKK